MCGCGGRTSRAKSSSSLRNHVIGEYMPFIKGHNNAPRNGAAIHRPPVYSEEEGCWLVPLSRGKFSKIDERDLQRVSQFTWSYGAQGAGPGYASGRVEGKSVLLHRFILNPPKGKQVDHINRDSLDNRRSNLRLASHTQNIRNASLSSRNSSGFIGVSFSGHWGKWVSSIKADGDTYVMGGFSCRIEAAIARDIAAISLHGQFAMLNFPELREVFA